MPQPKPASYFPASELKAIEKLGTLGFLHYKNPKECPVDKVRKPLMKWMQENRDKDIDSSCRSDEILSMAGPNFNGKPVGFGKNRKTLEENELYEEILEEFQSHIGDDVVAGTAFPTKEQLLQQRPAGNGGENNNNDAEENPTFFSFSAHGKQFSVPLSIYDAIRLYASGETSKFGKEGEGTKEDPKIRKSVEIPAEHLQLPAFLQHPEEAFPEMAEQVVRRLVPTSEKLRFVPYKLVCYRAPNDHFAPHVDTVYEDSEIATFVLHLPLQGDYTDKSAVLSSANDFSNETPGDRIYERELEDEADEILYPDVSDKTAIEEMSDEEKFMLPNNTRAEGGALRFFLGRGLVFDEDEYRENFMYGESPMCYGRPQQASLQNCASILLQNYYRTELVEGRAPNVPSFANKFACTPDMDFASYRNARERGWASVQDPAFAQERKIIADGDKRRHTPLHWAAWLTSVLHDVRGLHSGYRFVITYKVHRAGAEVFRIPSHIMSVHDKIAKLISVYKKKFIIDKKADTDGIKFLPRQMPPDSTVATPEFPCCAFTCRHTYPPASLSPSSLRRIDLTCWWILTFRYECVLAPVIIAKAAMTAAPFATATHEYDSAIPDIRLALTSMYQTPEDSTIDDWKSDQKSEELDEEAPWILNAGTFQLGFGDCYADARSYGNGDCEADFYYRAAAIVCTFRPSDWARKRVAFLILEKGEKDEEKNIVRKISQYYPIFRNFVGYL